MVLTVTGGNEREKPMFDASGVQAENESFVYCMPKHRNYDPGQAMAFEDQSCFQLPCLSPAGYFQQNVSAYSDIIPVYLWDSKQDAEKLVDERKVSVSETKPSPSGDAVPSSSEDPKSAESKIELEIEAYRKILNSEAHLFTSSSDFSGYSVRSLKGPKMYHGIQPVGISQGLHHSTEISFPTYRGQNFSFPRNNFSGSSPIYPPVNHIDRFQMREKSNLHKSYGVPNELVRGPRSTRQKPFSSSLAEKDRLTPFIRRDQYNKPDFQTKYEHAKFFMIKSYNEDDIHKSIKYSVWASTPTGNNKLDAAFRKADTDKIEKGIQCPLFLFFSVNASGQFVGLAEMIGPVDFKKNMDFWQQDKWNGFFPVKWHIVKDIPNKNFQHIILENNDNKAVTFSRDTQEIKLPQGLCMLQIFKASRSGTSMLDDFEFYEEKKEKSPSALSSNQLSPTTCSNMYLYDDSSMNRLQSSFGNMSMSARTRKPPAGKFNRTYHQ